jgi:hypothetical protein
LGVEILGMASLSSIAFSGVLDATLEGGVTGRIELTPISGLLHAHHMYDVPDRTGKFCATSMEMMSGAGLI